MNLKQQSIRAKKGEILFRKNLVEHETAGKKVFDDELDKEGIESVLKDRMETTIRHMRLLAEKNIVIGPYVEIGAERCQRSLVMENDLNVSGAAADISYDMLRSADYYKKAFNKAKMPFRICCDVTNLPLLSGSVPFVFCYETLHHFPNPALVTKEVHRVLSPGGYFFFDEEGFRKILHIGLYKGNKVHSRQAMPNSRIKRRLDIFFAKPNCLEVEYGIIENNKISIRSWRKALESFEDKDVVLRAWRIQTQLFKPKSLMRFILAFLLGGNVSGVCKKGGQLAKVNRPVSEIIVCPNCLEHKTEISLAKKDSSFGCPRCGNIFPSLDGILFLISQATLKELYPDIYKIQLQSLASIPSAT